MYRLSLSYWLRKQRESVFLAFAKIFWSKIPLSSGLIFILHLKGPYLMASVPVKPLPLLRRNITSTTASKSSPMLANVSSRHFLGIFTYNESLRQMRNPASLSHRRRVSTVVSSAGNLTAPSWDSWKPDRTAAATALLMSDVIWPAAG